MIIRSLPKTIKTTVTNQSKKLPMTQPIFVIELIQFVMANISMRPIVMIEQGKQILE